MVLPTRRIPAVHWHIWFGPISTLANEPNCHDRIALLIESERHTNGLLGRSLDIRYPLSPRVKGRDRGGLRTKRACPMDLRIPFRTKETLGRKRNDVSLVLPFSIRRFLQTT